MKTYFKTKNLYRKFKTKPLIKACLKLWADIVKSVGRCEICGVSHLQLHAHHICKRGWALCQGWFLLKNGLCVCYKCHSKIHDTNFNVVKQYHDKIIEILENKNINYDLLHLECKKRNVDLGLIKISLKSVAEMRQKGIELE
jgi:hypothetical protein